MCTAPRASKKAQKILNRVIGIPVNMIKGPQNKVQKRLRELMVYFSSSYSK